MLKIGYKILTREMLNLHGFKWILKHKIRTSQEKQYFKSKLKK